MKKMQVALESVCYELHFPSSGHILKMKRPSLVTRFFEFPLCVALGTDHILTGEDYQFLLCIFCLGFILGSRN
jgi:hypothetical protein